MRDAGRAWNPRLADSADGNIDTVGIESMCPHFLGGVPHALLQTGTPNDVDKFCRELIETVGKDGGFMLSTSTGITNEAKPENVKAMVEAAKKYGKY